MPRPSRRDDVRAAAARLIREHGYDSATMDLLADQVGLNKGTLYHYFPSKSAILFDLMSSQLDTTLTLIEQVPEDAPVADRMRAFVRLQVEQAATKLDSLVVFFQELPWIDRHLPDDEIKQLRSRVDSYERFANRLLEEGVASGAFRPMNTRMVLYSMIGIFAYVPGWFQSAQSRAGRAKLVDELTEFIMRGILA